MEQLEWYEKSAASFSANVLHMDFNQTTSGQIQLNFFEVEKYNAAWLTILNAFPTLDSECSKLNKVEVSNGTSICNVYSNAKTKEMERRCIPMKDKHKCEELIYKYNDDVNVTVDDADESLWRDFHVSDGHWSELLCMPYESARVSPYLVFWKTAQNMQNNSLNQFLESKIWSRDWAQDSGVCINSYDDVSIQTILEGGIKTTAYMETKCQAGYCWLTGKYHKVDDLPGDPWHNISSLSNPDDLFVCYMFTDQNGWIWLILLCGILFGWLGTVDLLCKWIVFPITRWIWLNINKVLNRSEVNRPTETAIVPRANTSGEFSGVVVMKHLYRKCFSDAAVFLVRRPLVELVMCPPLAEPGARSARSENATGEQPSRNS